MAARRCMISVRAAVLSSFGFCGPSCCSRRRTAAASGVTFCGFADFAGCLVRIVAFVPRRVTGAQSCPSILWRCLGGCRCQFFTALPATSAAAALSALAGALCLTCSSLHGTLAAGTCRRLSHAVSRLQMLHHRAHSSARTSATRAGKFCHYTLV